MPRFDACRARGLLLGLLLAALPAAAFACEPPDPARARDDGLTVWSDGSFSGAARDDRWMSMTGRPVRDIGGGRIGQIIQSEQCGIAEVLLLVDCTTGAAVAIHGIPGPSPDGDPAIWRSARALQAPYGPLALSPSSTVAEVARLARREGWEIRDDVPAWAAERGPRNALDPFMGCRIFYPGSVGAGR